MSRGQTLSEECKAALKTAFEDIDITRTGKISKSELRSALQLIGQNPTSEEMIAHKEGLGDGDFTFDEFLEYVEQRIYIKSQEEIDKELMDAFEKFNDDRDLLIGKDEFKKVMTKLGDEPLTEGDADSLLESLKNIEKNGMFNAAELAKLFMG